MTTLAATISSTGISAPTYSAILASLTSSYQSIYGSDAVLTPDTQDGQFLAILANAINDVNQSAIAVYNAYSPTYAQGVGLSSQVKINGIQRQSASYSSVPVTIIGAVGTTITSGVIQDNLGNLWNLPTTVTIPGSGEITVTATAQAIGAIVIGAQTFTINTPTAGWQSAVSVASSAPGAPVEQDGTLRQRQAVSTAAPSQSIEGGILAAVLNVAGVQAANIYENDSSVTDANGVPPNSIAVVVLGGDVQDIVNAIGARKTSGTGTYGNTSGTYVDPEGYSNTINYFAMTEVPITVNITLSAGSTYSSTTGEYIQESVAEFINSLGNGTFSLQNQLFAPANLSGDAATEATGLSQAALDVLRRTYQLLAFTQSRASPPINTLITGGPYAAGALTIGVASASDLYATCVITVTCSDSSTFNTTVQSVGGSAVGIYPPVPAGKTVNNSAAVYLASDVQIAFDEIATCSAGGVNITVLGS